MTSGPADAGEAMGSAARAPTGGMPPSRDRGAPTEKGTATPPPGTGQAAVGAPVITDVAGLQTVIDTLAGQGYTVIGPTRRGSAIVLAEIGGTQDLPHGCGDSQDAGTYRVTDRRDEAFFGFAATPQSWKAFLFPSRELLWSGAAAPGRLTVTPDPAPGKPMAFLGVRSCDLHAIYIQDRVLLGRAYTDPRYAARRADAFIIAVGCSDPSSTCFCVSMGTGPAPSAGFDLSLTELLRDGRHRFVARAGSERGAAVLACLAAPTAGPDDLAAAQAVTDTAAAHMGRHLDTRGIRDLLYASADHPRWDDAASRCLSCTNCTLVCPTCFCASLETVPDLTGEHLTRQRVWDSCFTSGHSHLSAGSVHGTTRSRYRQWLTHKLASWVDQFGTSGCVGCGRCITWCPAAIDITQEAAALRVPAPHDPAPGGEPA